MRFQTWIYIQTISWIYAKSTTTHKNYINIWWFKSVHWCMFKSYVYNVKVIVQLRNEIIGSLKICQNYNWSTITRSFSFYVLSVDASLVYLLSSFEELIDSNQNFKGNAGKIFMEQLKLSGNLAHTLISQQQFNQKI